MGFIGSGLIGKRHALDFRAEPDVAAIMAASVTSLAAYAGHRPRAAI